MKKLNQGNNAKRKSPADLCEALLVEIKLNSFG